MRKGLCLLLLSALTACHGSGGLQPGDLLFQVSEGSMSDAIESSTGGSFSHVGILGESLEDVWEAVPSEGVRQVSLREFLGESATDANGEPLVRVYRAPCDWPDVKRRLLQLQGRPYDFGFQIGTKALYCSELVFECYRRPDGSPLFQSIPMSFKGPDGKPLPFWESHYAALGQPIPEGAPGTNPNQLSQSPLLTPVPVRLRTKLTQ